MSKPIYIIGHRNPDTDSICSAIGYAFLKEALGAHVIAARAGKINTETKFVLETIGVEPPKLISDLYPRVKDVMSYNSVSIHPKATLRELGNSMKQNKLKSIAVIDDEQKLVGVVSAGDLANRYFEEVEMQDLAQGEVDFYGVQRALDGEVICGKNLERKVEGKVRIAAARIFTILNIANPGDIMLVSNNFDAQMACIQKGVACLIVTSERAVEEEVIDAANKQGVIIIRSPYDTYTCARLINQSIPVRMIMQKKIISFRSDDLLSDVKKVMASTNYRSYPVLDHGKLIGYITRDHLLNKTKEKVILVDHNEQSQAVEGIEEAKIIEIIDHHRLGGLRTSEPIFIRHEPVGCTATIVANMLWHRDVEIPPKIAGLLMAAIISDTMLFKSPTATPKDRDTAEKLAVLAGLNLEEFGMAVLRAGTRLGDMTVSELLRYDVKEFQIGEYRVAVAQLSVLDPEEILGAREQIEEDMESMCHRGHYDIVLFMITDIIKEGTYLLYSGKQSVLIAEAFGSGEGEELLYLPGVMSRKKQIIPPLSEAAREKFL
ncbi:putative manganese-dependent inorganic diphosphatase [Propionispora hippei]|uniref:inorganic diphosphatase n=1 Tax=Propionispora hippei DSM 15287 TaxID=1123003 RepID=A0A1M6GFG8_9FIRM|nr:putative manganese-dependent inorganic diphosphatase [Propionispora hippei]SHJ08692.1 manganese-dependent inorganic pyrophosphatase [Propionispora hippei DSM 15287]